MPPVVKAANDTDRPRVLIIEDDAPTRETIRVLLGSIGYQCVFAFNVSQAQALLEQEKVSLAILDTQREGFSQLILRLRGRVIVVTDASLSPELKNLIRLYSLPRIQRDRLIHELAESLEALLRPSTALQRITRVARLIFDSFREPLPDGVRNSERTTRRLVYECGPLSLDLSFEPKKDSPLIEAVGQIVDSTNLGHPLEGVLVVLQGRKGPIALVMTNEFGEFRVEFEGETMITVELETSKSYWVTVVSPGLEWATKAAGAYS